MLRNNIAVYVGENGETASLNKKGKFVVYGKDQGQWNVLREINFNWKKGTGNLKQMRQELESIIHSLVECNIFIGLSITGLPYYTLEKANFSIWECQGNPLDFLDDVLAKEEEVRMELANQEEEEIPKPEDLGNGCYRISLKEIQQKNSQFTSKQVLLPFIRQGKFYGLEVICNHIPPWLEIELISDNLNSQIEKNDLGEIKINIAKKTCN